MAAITKRLLHLRPNLHSYPRPHLCPLHHFSSSSDPDPPADIPQSETVGEPDSSAQTQTKSSSFFDDVKASLQREPPPQDRQQTFRKPFSFSNRTRQTPPPSKEASFEEIRRNISEFRLRSAAPPPSSSPGQYVSMQELYKKNVLSMTDDSATSSDSLTEEASMRPAPGGRLSYNGIRESLSNLKSNINDSGGNPVDRISLARFKETLKLKPDPNANLGSTRIIGGSDSFPPNFLGKERRINGVYDLGSTGSVLPGFLKMSDRLDLGKKLKMLRPEKRKGKWFSLQELSERLAKVREIEDKESQARIGITNKVLRDSLKMSVSNDDKPRPRIIHRLDFMGQVGGTPSIMLSPDSPPKENLVEKFFHPDNMSSAEKLKLELKRVRDEFKMSESDCGSARVQVAQLTTKIKHLSNVLQKKDKHSRRGLQAMVQRRKKLLKYLRRTDWDSYCFVISKLGLRDNPDVKA